MNDKDHITSKCLDFLWKLISRDGQKQSVRDAAMELFCEARTNMLLSRGDCKEYRARFVDECIANLKRHAFVAESLTVLRGPLPVLVPDFGKSRAPKK